MHSILMIDDDRDFGALASAHFTKLGYKFTLSHDGGDGLAKSAQVKPDLILLDIMMPGMNGVEVLRELQAGDETSDIPVILVTGKYIDPGMQGLFSQERNFRALLAKPVSFASLQQAVETVLKK